MAHATHANAALTPRARLRIGRLVIDHGWSPARAAECFDVSWRTAQEWAERYRDGAETSGHVQARRHYGFAVRITDGQRLGHRPPPIGQRGIAPGKRPPSPAGRGLPRCRPRSGTGGTRHASVLPGIW